MKHKINDQLTAMSLVEFAAQRKILTQKTSAFAGLKYKDLGSFGCGRNPGALYDVEAWTDMFRIWWRLAQTDNE